MDDDAVGEMLRAAAEVVPSQAIRPDLDAAVARGSARIRRRRVVGGVTAGVVAGLLVAAGVVGAGLVPDRDQAVRTLNEADGASGDGGIDGQRVTDQNLPLGVSPGPEPGTVEITFEGVTMTGSSTAQAAPGWRDQPVVAPGGGVVITGATVVGSDDAPPVGVVVVTAHADAAIGQLELRVVDAQASDSVVPGGDGLAVLAVALHSSDWANAMPSLQLTWSGADGTERSFEFRPRLGLEPCEIQQAPPAQPRPASTLPMNEPGAVAPPVVVSSDAC